ncbi:MAG TPA: serine/threonine-protein kinase [Pedococcus sp.]
MDPQRIADRYDVVRAIGRGGMGTVWLCRDSVLGRDVAVKQIGDFPGEPANETRRAMREARAAAALNHPNAVAVYDVVDHGGRPWLVMEYVEGETLADRVAREGRLEPAAVASIGAQLASALNRAHERGIIHRDIKPGNVLLDRHGRPKISDFGIARGHGDDALTQTGFVTGTPGYLSPELARGEDPSAASDVWALGATLYAAVEGRAPYPSQTNPIATLQAIATREPDPMEHAGGLGGAIAAMMDTDRAQRWDMATAAERLGRIATGALTMPLGAAAAGAAAGAAATELLPTTQDPTQAMPAPGATGATAAYREPTPPPSPAPAPAAGEDDRRSRTWIPALLVALLVVALGAYAYSQLGGDGGGSASSGPTTSATTPPATTSQEQPPTTTSEPTTSEPQASTSTTSAPAQVSDSDVEQFVRGYFNDVTQDRDKTWEQLTPRMQDAAGGRDGYESFWSGIESVDVRNLKGDGEGLSATVTLVYQKQGGDKSTERKEYSFVQAEDGSLLIDQERSAGGGGGNNDD